MNFHNRNASSIYYGLLMLSIATVDSLTDINMSLWVLYFVPIGLVTWNLGARYGWAFAAAAVLLICATELIIGQPFSSLFYYTISCASKAIAYGLFVALIGALRKKEVERVFIPSRSRG